MRLPTLITALVPGLAVADDPAAQVMERLRGETPLLDDLRDLTDTIGGRPTGSAAFDRAVAWGVARFEEAGLENVHTEPRRRRAVAA